MRNSRYTPNQANNYFAQVKRAWIAIRIDDHVKFVDNYKLIHGRVTNKWYGKDPRLVVLDDFGKTHYFRALDGLMVLAYEVGSYVPATEFGNMRVAH